MMNDELYPHLVEIFPSVICPKSMDFNSQLVLDKFMKKKWKIDDTSNFDFIRYTQVEWVQSSINVTNHHELEILVTQDGP